MKIFFYDVEGKLKINSYPFSDLETDFKHHPDNEPWFAVIHGGHKSTFWKTNAAKTISKCVALGGGVLFISASPFGGLYTERTAIEEERKFEGGRVHFLRSDCQSYDSPAAKRVMVFLEVVKNLQAHKPIPWNLLEANPYPENLVAIYVLLKAFQLAPERRNDFADKWNQLDADWRRNLVERASSEYETFSDNANDGKPLDLTIDMFDPREINSKDFLLLSKSIEASLSKQFTVRSK